MKRPPPYAPAAASAAAFLAVSAFAIACSSGGDGQPSTPGSGTPGTSAATVVSVSAEDALARYVQNRYSQGFVAECAKAKRPGDVGKQCATKLGERQGLVAYSLGPTFSEGTRILIMRPENGDWTLVTTLNVDPSQPTAPGIPWPLTVGSEVLVSGTGDCLKIREEPGVTSAELDCVDDGTTVTVVGGPTTQDNIEWWQLKDLGWAAGTYLRYPDAALAPTPSPQP